MESSSGKETTIVDNEVYNLLSSLVNKLQGLAAYDKYTEDGSANDSLWQELRQTDQQSARKLLAQLDQMASDGKLKAS